MKIIISHDIDHLYPSDHVFRDFIFPKLWIRSFIELYQRNIGVKTCFHRLISLFDKRLNRIPEIIEFDILHNIRSVFFFGMDNILGMSYKKNIAIPWINLVLEKGFDAGVHGVEIENAIKMKKEFDDFQKITSINSFGIRTHYVRYNENTFDKMADLHYAFDTSEFNKRQIELKPPYKIGNMWEFPLHIMDGYILTGSLATAKEKTVAALEKGKETGLKYFTFLFHDYLFNENTYPKHKAYYEWFVNYCITHNLGFVSYKEAIAELDKKIASSRYGK
jgi:hypothetical protein